MHLAIDATVVREPRSGVHHAVAAETLALVQLGQCRITVFVSDDKLVYALSSCDCEVVKVRTYRFGVTSRICWQQVQLPSLLKKHACDLLFAPAYTAPLRLQTPVVLQIHDTIALRRPDLCRWRNRLHMGLLMKASMQRARHMIVSTSSEKAHVQHLVPSATAITALSLGVEAAHFENPPPQSSRQRPVDNRYLLFIGTIEPKKGVDILLAAYARIAAKFPDLKLVLIGQQGWRCRQLLHQIAHWQGAGAVLHLGYQPEQELHRYLHAAAAVVVPSVEEGFGLPILEAFAAGTPVIHSDHPALLETAGGHGQAFTSGNPDACAAALQAHLNAPPDADGRRQRKSYAATRSWERWAQATMTICKQL